MKVILLLIATTILMSCNFKDGVKETGDAIQDGANNIVDAVKETPAAISEASNKLEADIKD